MRVNPGQVLASRFEVEARAGEGGMGAVFRARDRYSGALVALKVLASGVGDAVERFAREAAVLVKVRHPGIVRYVDHGVGPEGESYLAMEWLEGETLQQRLKRGAFGIAEVIDLAERVADALGAAHMAGLVHRDIKPSNLFLVDGAVERIKILDFGIVHLANVSHSTTRTGMVLGTPGYMAPEQARGAKDIDARADVFSLGCVLYECLTGQVAFAGEHIMAVLAKILCADAPSLAEARPDVPSGLERLVMAMMAKVAEERPRNGAEVAAAVEALRRGGLDAAAVGERAPAITRGEQRVFSVVLAARGSRCGGGDRSDPQQTNELAGAPPFLEQLRLALAPTGAQVEHLGENAVIATLAGAGGATDRVAAAARCALAMRKRLPNVPMVLSTGRGVLHGAGPVGEVIDRAARLLRAAREGEGVLLDDVTAGLLDARFDVRGRAAGLELFGEHEPRDATRRLLGRPTTTVGRDRELRSLEATLDECVNEGAALAVLVTAPAGVGKSRLRWELAARLARRDEPVELWVGRGDPMRAGAPFGLLAQALRRALGVLDGEPRAAQQSKLRARAGRHFAGEKLQRVAEFLGELIGVHFPDGESVQLRAARRDAQLMGDQMRQAWEDWLCAECAERPVALVLEDLQWGDAPTVAFVDAALRTLRDSRLFVLALARPEVHEVFPQLWRDRPITELRLAELSRKACEKLVREVLAERADDTTVQRLVERAGGNALYLEEMIRAVAGGASELPETVLAMVQARLESLPAMQRRVLRAAAVFGQVFWQGGVQVLLGEGSRETPEWLADLAERELIVRKGRGKFPGEEELGFRHVIVREAAYGMLTDADRVLGHRLAAEWLAARGERDAVALADHFERGGVAERAVEFYQRASEQALAAHDFAGSLARAGRGVTCVAAGGAGGGGAPGEALGALRLVEAEAHRWRGEHADAQRRAVEAASLLPPGSARWLRAVEEAIQASGRQGQYAPVVEWSEVVMRASSAETTALVICLCAAGRQLYHAGRYDLAEQVIARVRELAAGLAPDETSLDPPIAAQVFGLTAAAARHMGDLLGDLRGYQRVLAASEAAGDLRNACNTRVSLGFAYVELGDFAGAEEELRAALAAAEKMGLTTIATRARQNLGLVLARRGAFAEAAALEERTIAESVAQGNMRFEGWTRIYLSSILLGAGDAAGAEREARAAADRLSVTPPALAGALAALAQALIAQGRAAEAVSPAFLAVGILDELGGIEEFESLVRLAWAEALQATGGTAEAAEAIARGRDRLLARAERIEDPAWRASFLERVPENARILALAGGVAAAGKRPEEPS